MALRSRDKVNILLAHGCKLSGQEIYIHLSANGFILIGCGGCVDVVFTDAHVDDCCSLCCTLNLYRFPEGPRCTYSQEQRVNGHLLCDGS